MGSLLWCSEPLSRFAKPQSLLISAPRQTAAIAAPALNNSVGLACATCGFTTRYSARFRLLNEGGPVSLSALIRLGDKLTETAGASFEMTKYAVMAPNSVFA